MCIDVYQSRHVSQVKIKFRLKFFNPGWFYISLICLLAFIIQELGLGDEGNNLTSEFNLNCNKCASTKSHARMRPDACTCISRCMICIYLVCLVLAGTVAHRNGLKKSSKLKWNRQSFNKNFLWEIAIDLFPAIKLKGLSVHFSENCMHETEKKKLHHHNIIYIVDTVLTRL